MSAPRPPAGHGDPVDVGSRLRLGRQDHDFAGAQIAIRGELPNFTERHAPCLGGETAGPMSEIRQEAVAKAGKFCNLLMHKVVCNLSKLGEADDRLFL
jgi:hypothetical protein